MKTLSKILCPALRLALVSVAIAGGAIAYAADIYVPIVPCRILETRDYNGFTGSGALLPAAASPYTYGTSNASVIAQKGNASGCGIPSGISGIGASVAMLKPGGTGDVRAWSPATAMPGTAIGVFNSTQLFSGAFANIPVDASGTFDVKVDNASVYLAIDVFGYWTPLPSGAANQTLRFSATNTLAANNLLQTFSDGGLIAGGTFGTGTIPTTADGSRMMWYPGKAAFRSGTFGSIASQDNLVGNYSTAMGFNSRAGGSASFAVGSGAVAQGEYSVAMGSGADAEGDFSIVLGSGSAVGLGSILIGSGLSSNGTASIVMGTNASDTPSAVSHIYGFVFGDNSAQTINDADHQFMVRASGGYKFLTSSGTAGASLAAGAGSWTSLSDRNAKNAMLPVNARDVLARVVAMPLSTWHYKTQDSQYRHMGPMAQDFYAAFKLGESDTGIDTVDADGVALAAIQGLNALIAEKDAKASQRLEEKDREIAALRAEVSAQKSRVAALESIADDLADVKAQIAALRRTAPVMVALHP